MDNGRVVIIPIDEIATAMTDDARALLDASKAEERRSSRAVRRASEVAKIQCPKCQGWGSRVRDSRSATDGEGVKRKRQCRDCGYQYVTIEILLNPAKTA